MLAALALLLLTGLTACSKQPGYIITPGYLQRLPPEREVMEGPIAQGGITAELLTAGVTPLVPDGMVDAIIGDTLRPWLAPMERKDLAYASQNAAVAERNLRISWRTRNPAGEMTASGSVQPISDIYRSLRGRLCRDVRQFVDRNEGIQWQQITLCREMTGANLYVWVVGNAY